MNETKILYFLIGFVVCFGCMVAIGLLSMNGYHGY